MKVNKSETMLYVNDVEESKVFWQEKVGLVMLEKRSGPNQSAAYAINAGETTFVLMNKALVEQFSPEINSGVPSIMFCVDSLEVARDGLIENGVDVTEIFEVSGMRTFSFCDNNGYYYAVKEGARTVDV